MSLVTNDIPPKPYNKESSQNFDDPMISEDWVDCTHVVDREGDSKNLKVEVSHDMISEKKNIPPKNMMWSEESAKVEKKGSQLIIAKLRKSFLIDHFLGKLNYNILFVNFTKLLQFLESDDYEMSFPFISKNYEEFFKMLVLDINILKSKSLDSSCREICDKIYATITSNKAVYLLTSAYESRKGFKNVLVIKKQHFMEGLEESAHKTSAPESESTPKLSEEELNELLEKSRPTVITDGFKIHCLRASLAFVKNNATQEIEFPELSTEQAQYMQLLLESGVLFADFDNLEIKELYTALREAIKIYSLKYEFKVTLVESSGDKKSLVFEKILKQKPAEPIEHCVPLKPAEPVEPVDSVVPIEPVEPVVTIEPDVLMEPVVTMEHVLATAPVMPMEPFEHMEPVVPMDPDLPMDLVEHMEQVLPSEPVLPVNSAVPIGYVLTMEPLEHMKPILPLEPVLPVVPIEPVMPMESVKHMKLVVPMEPDFTIEPVELMEPVFPMDSVVPIEPVVSMEPDGHIEPVLPTEPVLPIEPVVSMEPVEHMEPIMFKEPVLAEEPVVSIEPSAPPILVEPRDIPVAVRHENAKDESIVNKIENISIKKAYRLQFQCDLVKRLPRTFILEAFDTIAQFLTNNTKQTKIFVPQTEDEYDFYRGVIDWSRNSPREKVFNKEYQELFENIECILRTKNLKCRVPKKRMNKPNAITGIREVKFIKKVKPLDFRNINKTGQNPNKRKDSINSDSTDRSVCSLNKSKKKKIKLQNTCTVKCDGSTNNLSVTDIYRSNQTSIKKAVQQIVGINEAAKLASTRCCSQERKIAKPVKKTNKPTPVIPDWPRARRDIDMQRKELLIEALSVPVQCVKAEKMMRGMGWSGGALGARGNGITEPIMPVLDLQAGAGLGHTKNIIKPNKNSTAPKTTQIWQNIAPSQTLVPKTDIIVQKTKQLLQTNHSFDTIMKIDRTKSIPVQKTGAVSELTTPTHFREDVLNCILDLLDSERQINTLKYKKQIGKKDRSFLSHLLQVLANRSRIVLPTAELELVERIIEKYDETPRIVVKACVSDNHKEVELKKVNIYSLEQLRLLGTKQHESTVWSNTINSINDNRSMEAYIDALALHSHTKKACNTLKFRVLILLRILKMIRSLDDELVVLFNKVLPVKQKNYVESTVEAINNKKKFGSAPAEIAVSIEILNNIQDKFFGVIFNHQYTAFTLTKYTPISHFNLVDREFPQKLQSIKIDLDNLVYESPENKYDNDEENYTTNLDDIIANIKKTIGNKSSEVSNVKYNTAAAIKNSLNKTDVPASIIKNNDHSKKEISDKHVNSTKLEIDRLMSNRNKNLTARGKEMTVAEDTDVEYVVCVDFKKETIKQEIVDKSTIDYKNSVCNNETIAKKQEQIIDKYIKDTKIEDMLSDIEDPIDQDLMVIDNAVCIDRNEYRDISVDEVIDNIDEVLEDSNVTRKAIKNEPITVIDNVESIKGIGRVVPTIDDEKTIVSISVQDRYSNKDLKHNIGLSEIKCDIKSRASHSELMPNNNLVQDNSANSSCSNRLIRKINPEIKNVYLVPSDYPDAKLTKDKAKEIQKLISLNIQKSTELPLLMCHGVQNGALIYTCHNKKSLLWLRNTISVASEFKVFYIKDVQRMALKFYCLFDFDTKYLFSMIELYNQGLSTKEWVVEKEEFHEDYALFLVKMDTHSVSFIHSSDLALFAGVDKVEFSLIWD